MKRFLKKLGKYLKELGKLIPLALGTVILPGIGSTIFLIFGYPLVNWLRENWEIGLPVFLFGVVFLCGFSLLHTNIIGIIGGWAFGFYAGLGVLMGGIVGAAIVSFFIHSRIVGDKLPQIFEERPKAKAIFEALVNENFTRTFLIIALLRLTPALPFALTNFLMASARVSIKSFVLGTFFGMLPRSAAVIFVGAGLSELTFDNSQDKWLIILGIAATIIAVVVIGSISKRALNKLTTQHQST